MSSAPFCRVCLASNRKINCIDNIELRKIFEKLKGTEVCEYRGILDNQELESLEGVFTL